MKAIVTFLFAALCCAAQTAQAFGPEGHQIVATIAMSYLSPVARQNIQRVLGNTTPQQAATWMDEVRGDQAYSFMSNWHFINIEKGKTYKPGGRNHIVSELERVYTELHHPEKLSKKARKEDLMILIHLMGDLHQPLHVGYKEDRGGNDVRIRMNGRYTDLHHVWDTDIIEQQHITATACVALSSITARDIAKAGFAQAQFVQYLNDSRAGLAAVYAFSGNSIDQAYLNKSRQVVMFQLLHAGLRLAAILQQLFDPAPAAEGEPGLQGASGLVPSAAGNTIAAAEAARHPNERVTACGKVFGGNVIQRSGATYINVGAAYPNSPLTLVILAGDRDKFPDDERFYEGKNICVTGTVKLYNGKAEVNVSRAEQIIVQ
jgi:hypothetical protein